MRLFPRRYQTYFILPITLLLVNILEVMADYKVQQYYHNIHIQTLIMIVLYGAGFALTTTYLAPWIKSLFVKAHKGSRKTGGGTGLLIFYIITFSLMYYLYFTYYAYGAAYLFPPQWR